MKWGTISDNERAAKRVNSLFARIVSNRAFYMLVVLGTIALLSGAGSKWAP